jgi:hypothetical protein
MHELDAFLFAFPFTTAEWEQDRKVIFVSTKEIKLGGERANEKWKMCFVEIKKTFFIEWNIVHLLVCLANRFLLFSLRCFLEPIKSHRSAIEKSIFGSFVRQDEVEEERKKILSKRNLSSSITHQTSLEGAIRIRNGGYMSRNNNTCSTCFEY